MALGAPGTLPDGVRGAVHKMVGLAGTIGFPSVRLKAAELEELLYHDVHHPADAWALLSAMREAFVQDARHAADSCPADVRATPAALLPMRPFSWSTMTMRTTSGRSRA